MKRYEYHESTMDQRLGKCYELSWQYINAINDPNTKELLVHGYITDKIGRTIDHAWTENGNNVYDPVMDKTMPRMVYYSLLQVEVFKKYTYDEAIKMGMKTKVYGPWHKIPAGKVKWWKERAGQL